MDGKDKVEVEEVKAVVEKTETELPAKSDYDDFVEGVASREIALAQGGSPERIARVFQGVRADGEPVIHLAGDGQVVSHIGDILERGGYGVQEWHIKRPDDVSKEAEKVRPALDRLLKSVPVPILDDPGDFIRKAIGLPVKAIKAGSEAIDDAAAKIDEVAEELGSAIKDFEPGKNTQEELEGKGV
ncbi:hypothetical protein ES705_21015 [subsurface metagenome]